MKNLFLIGVVLFSSFLEAEAQSGSTYQDDIYYTAEDARRDAQKKAKKKRNNSQESNASADNYDPNNGNYDALNDQDFIYDNTSYIDYDDDDYTYSSYLIVLVAEVFMTVPILAPLIILIGIIRIG
jgi:hypothetical protein